MKKIILSTGILLTVGTPLATMISCSDIKQQEEQVGELQSEYSVSSPKNLLQIFKAAKYNVSENEARDFYQAFSSLKPTQPLKAIVYKGKERNENYDAKNIFILIKGVQQKENSTLTTTDSEIISSGADDVYYNVAAAFDDQLSKSDKAKQAPILFESFGIKQSDLDDASFGFLLSSANGKNAKVEMQQFQRATIDKTQVIYAQLGAFDTNIIGQIPEDETKEIKYVADELGLHDYKEITNNAQQWEVAKNTKAASQTLYKSRMEEALKAANTHINNLFDAGISQQERIDNKGKTRYLKIDIDEKNKLQLHWIENNVDYLIQIHGIADPTTNTKALPQFLNYIKAVKVDDQSIIHDEAYYSTHIEGLKWKKLNSLGKYEVDDHYFQTYMYITGLAQLKDYYQEILLGLSEAKTEWIA